MSDLPGTGADPQDAFGSQPPPRQTSRAGYWWALALVILAFVGGGGWAVVGFAGLEEDVRSLQRLDIPGQGVFALAAGEQSVYYEGAGSGNIRFAILAEDGTEVPIRPHSGRVTYDVGGYSGESVFGYTIAEAGEYRVSVQGQIDGQVAFGPGVGGKIVAIVLVGLAIFFGGLVAALVVFLVTRSRRKRPPAPPPPPPPPVTASG